MSSGRRNVSARGVKRTRRPSGKAAGEKDRILDQKNSMSPNAGAISLFLSAPSTLPSVTA
jgi:hypothetical protein